MSESADDGDTVPDVINDEIVTPSAGVSYPITVRYCGECTLPLEYCEYGPNPDKCRKWLESNAPDLMQTLTVVDSETTPADADNKDDQLEGGGDDKKHRQKRGGKGSKPVSTSTKVKTITPTRITLQRAPRGKNKSVTVIKGLGTFGIELKTAARFFASRFACGSSVTGVDEIVIQGDVKDELIDIIPEKWPQVDEDSIDDIGDQKR